MHAIYQILNTQNGKRYVGSSVNLDKRIRQHKIDLNRQKHGNKHLQDSWNKYGAEAFSFTVLEAVENPEGLLSREQFWIDTSNPEYNIDKVAGSSLGVKRSPETIEKIRKANLGLKHPEWRCKIKSIAQGGNNHWTKRKSFSEEAKKIMSEAQKKLYRGGYISPVAKEVIQFTKTGEFVGTYVSLSEAARQTDGSGQAIGMCAIGKIKTSGGFVWRYKTQQSIKQSTQ